jgi:hypothetical protein
VVLPVRHGPDYTRGPLWLRVSQPVKI